MIVGDAPYASEYIARAPCRRPIRGSASSARSTATGYRVLRSHATAYVQATEVGGTHPALVEAMGFGNAIVANDVPEHRETLGDAGRYYRGPDDLATAARTRCSTDDVLAETLRAARSDRAARLYGWDVDRRRRTRRGSWRSPPGRLMRSRGASGDRRPPILRRCRRPR